MKYGVIYFAIARVACSEPSKITMKRPRLGNSLHFWTCEKSSKFVCSPWSPVPHHMPLGSRLFVLYLAILFVPILEKTYHSHSISFIIILKKAMHEHELNVDVKKFQWRNRACFCPRGPSWRPSVDMVHFRRCFWCNTGSVNVNREWCFRVSEIEMLNLCHIIKYSRIRLQSPLLCGVKSMELPDYDTLHRVHVFYVLVNCTTPKSPYCVLLHFQCSGLKCQTR